MLGNKKERCCRGPQIPGEAFIEFPIYLRGIFEAPKAHQKFVNIVPFIEKSIFKKKM